MLTKITDDLYIDLNRLECISKNDGGKYYLALQNREPTRITYEHFKTLCNIIDSQHKSYLPTDADMFNARLEALCDTKSSSVVGI